METCKRDNQPRTWIHLTLRDSMALATSCSSRPSLGLTRCWFCKGSNWIWATNEDNRSWLRERFYTSGRGFGCSTPLAARDLTPTIGKYERTHLSLLDAEIPWRVALIRDWDGTKAPKVRVMGPLALPE